MKIIASLTTIPSRIEHIQPVIESIRNQSVFINAIELNIPFIFERTGEAYTIPNWLLELVESSKKTECEIRIFRTEDYGAITKVAPTIFRYSEAKEVLIWSVDDDFKYPVNTLSALLWSYKPSNRYVLSHSCGNWIYDESTGDCIDYNVSYDESLHDFLESSATVLYPAHLFLNDFEDYINIIRQVLDNICSDDIIISNYLALKEIKVYNCKLKLNSVYTLAELHVMSYGLTNDAPLYALEQLKYEQHKRYVRVFNWLKAEKMNGWVENKVDNQHEMKKIIITGTPRSGSSALNNILNQSPIILSTEEIGIYTFNGEHYWNCKPNQLKLPSNQKYLTQKNLTAYDLDNFFHGNFANKGNIEFFGDKFLAYSWDDIHINHTVKNYPDAYFIFTYRNPCASIYSGFKRSQSDGNEKADWFFKGIEESTRKHIAHASSWSTRVYPNVKKKIIIDYDYYINNIELLIKDLSEFFDTDMLISDIEKLIGYNECFDDGNRGLYIHPNPNEYKDVFSDEAISYINSQTHDVTKYIRELIEKEAILRIK